jgi:UDP-glucose 4-epimerase
MTSLITGATGFVGRALTNELVGRGERVIALTRDPYRGDISKSISWRLLPKAPAGWNEILDEIETVYHFAWSSLPQSSNEDPLSDASDNILGSLRLFEACKGRSNLRIVFPSSGGTVYGVLTSVPASEQHDTRPRCAYGVSKLAVERYLALYHDLWGLDCTALRISNAYGPGQLVGRNFGAISTFAARVAKGEPITVFGDGSVTRDYLYIDDLVEALIAAGAHRGGPIVMNIGSGVGKSLNDVVDALARFRTNGPEVRYVPARNLDVPVSVLDISLAQTILKWKPRTSFQHGVEATFIALSST